MKNLRKWSAWLGAGAVVMTLSAGCADRNKNGQPDDVATSGETANATNKMADSAAKTADNATDAAGKAVDSTGKAIAKGADNAADAVTGAGAALTLTPKIKTALGANNALNGSKIDVDTNGTTKTVVLRGTVKTASQKNLAESIAKREAAGFKITNQLKTQ